IIRQRLGKEEVPVDPLGRCRLRGHRSLGKGGRGFQFILGSRQQQDSSSYPFRDVWVGGRPETAEQVPPRLPVLIFMSEKQAQFGVSEPGIVFGRIGLQRLLPFPAQLLTSSLANQVRSQKVRDVRLARGHRLTLP